MAARSSTMTDLDAERYMLGRRMSEIHDEILSFDRLFPHQGDFGQFLDGWREHEAVRRGYKDHHEGLVQ